MAIAPPRLVPPARLPRLPRLPWLPTGLALLIAACGSGGSDGTGPADTASGDVVPPAALADDVDPAAPTAPSDPTTPDAPIVPPIPAPLDPLTGTAGYRITLENLWGAEAFPQGFPDDAHLSLVGGAMHDASVSFWRPGAVVSDGMEDMAETGMIDILLDEEVAPAIASGAAGSRIAVREYTGPSVGGEPGRLGFDLQADARWPLLTLVTMLGPSPDWFVGVHDLALDTETGWIASAAIDLPLYDGGTKSDVQPLMGGPDIIPPLPVALVAYDAASGTYQPSDVPQTVARLLIERVR